MTVESMYVHSIAFIHTEGNMEGLELNTHSVDLTGDRYALGPEMKTLENPGYM